MRVAILGRSGQIAKELIELLMVRSEYKVSILDRNDCDFESPDEVIEALQAISPELIINAIAWTNVDGAESEEARADLVNHITPQRIAKYAAQNNAWLIHYSTDYVFDGANRTAPWREDDPVAPINAYGRTKLAGERAIIESSAKYLILRTSWVYSYRGNNFVKTMLNLAATRDRLSVVDDQSGVPNYAPDLAAATLAAIDHLSDDLAGVYHLSAAGATTWYGFARKIFSAKGVDVIVDPVDSSAFKTVAQRPAYSVLDATKFSQSFGHSLPAWEDALERALIRIDEGA